MTPQERIDALLIEAQKHDDAMMAGVRDCDVKAARDALSSKDSVMGRIARTKKKAGLA